MAFGNEAVGKGFSETDDLGDFVDSVERFVHDVPGGPLDFLWTFLIK